MGIFDAEGGHLIPLGSNGFTSMLGYPKEYLAAMDAAALRSLVHQDDRTRLEALIQRVSALRNGDSAGATLQLRHADGGWRAVRLQVAVFTRDAADRPAAILGTVITADAAGETDAPSVLAGVLEQAPESLIERRHLEQALREQAERFALIVRSARLGWWTYEFGTGVLSWSDESRHLFAWPAESQPTYKGFLATVHALDRPRVTLLFERAVEVGGRFEVEFRILLPGGEERWVRASAECHCDDFENPLSLFGVMIDITPSKRAEAALRESEERFRQLAETISEIFWVLDPVRHKWLYVSPAYRRLFGLREDQSGDQPDPEKWLRAVHPDDRERVGQVLAGKVASGRFDHEYRVRTPRGTRRMRDRGVVSRDSSGRVMRVLGVTEDVTDQARR
ncbi:PAS domain-containing protein [Aromatoleum diolicum]|uniref:PAS domain-containing protein n=1 Tax=Aromatoleum diolicum TaxID=75796 RepID=UPI00145E24C9